MLVCFSITKLASPKKSLVALVKYNNVIYQCQKVIKTNCGHTINCDNLSVHCANNIAVEYLK